MRPGIVSFRVIDPETHFRVTTHMGCPKNTVPTYRHHKPSDSARCWINGGWVTLGRYNSPKSRAEYARIVAECSAGVTIKPATGLTVNEVLLAYLRHADGYYRRPDGTPTNETENFKAVIAVARITHGHSPAAEFGPLALKAVRQAMITRGWARTTVNAQTRRLRSIVRWCC